MLKKRKKRKKETKKKLKLDCIEMQVCSVTFGDRICSRIFTAVWGNLVPVRRPVRIAAILPEADPSVFIRVLPVIIGFVQVRN